MDRKTRSVDNQIGHFPQRTQPVAFGGQGGFKAHALTLQRMWAAGGGVAAHEFLRVSLQKQQKRTDALGGHHAQGVVDFIRKIALAHIHAQGNAHEMTHGRTLHHTGHFRGQTGGQTIHGEIAQIFKNPQGRTFARAGKAGNNTNLHGALMSDFGRVRRRIRIGRTAAGGLL